MKQPTLETLPKYLMNRIAGIYFLFKEGNLIYIGQSANIIVRMYDHMNMKTNTMHQKVKDFDEVKFIELDEEIYPKNIRSWIESIYIRHYQPPLNSVRSKASEAGDDDTVLKLHLRLDYPF